MSHPVWVRGLKHCGRVLLANEKESHPVWVRGLKPYIEELGKYGLGRTPCGCVD